MTQYPYPAIEHALPQVLAQGMKDREAVARCVKGLRVIEANRNNANYNSMTHLMLQGSWAALLGRTPTPRESLNPIFMSGYNYELNEALAVVIEGDRK